MSLSIARFHGPNGARCDLHHDDWGRLSQHVGQTKHVGLALGLSWSLKLRGNFRWWPTVALPAGWTYEDVETVPLKRLCLRKNGNSDPEGRGYKPDAPPVVNAAHIWRNTYPDDGNMSGPGDPWVVGPSLIMLDQILSRGDYDRGYTVSMCTGSKGVIDLYGTNGNDGVYATQRDHVDVCGGIEGANPAPLIHPDDDILDLFGLGHVDAGVNGPDDYYDRVLALLARIYGDFPSNNLLGTLVHRLPPSAPDNVDPSITHPKWQDRRADQLALHDPTATPPRIVLDHQDSDRIQGDWQHTATGTDETFGWRRLATAGVGLAVSAGWIL